MDIAAAVEEVEREGLCVEYNPKRLPGRRWRVQSDSSSPFYGSSLPDALASYQAALSEYVRRLSEMELR
jgi:hypothetical protein